MQQLLFFSSQWLTLLRESYVGQVGGSGVELTPLVSAGLVVLAVLLGLQGV